MDPDLGEAIRQIPSGRFILTAAYNGARSGAIVEWVQQCATTPPMIVAAVATDLPVVPLIRDSHGFALCQVSAIDRFLERKFAAAPEPDDDPFEALEIMTAPSGAPLLQRAVSYLDCEVIRHFDLESDFGLYVGLVRHGGILAGGTPAIRFGGNGESPC